ncbi:zinc-binding alcohol dehydrogenase family protein [Pseudogracilibacillus auburnensis]|uniref:NADPH:quinone reductase-like Zn-dependent oxidoreductase n=1 Tax=Pseudogracilibacillus auburnensis TaxID=1494959 RepID=A0A2V3W8Z7_9BACI|nr:zinc-binding dehydrogenase [Pseudogracilibacillus auburnensis]PXW90520.1 NADPH:quinone reductase-like Zn-dependent oxidoreductase [Pseudogracilibacillus auburnensis]
MKAAVLHKIGEIPRYGYFPEPLPGNDETLIQVKAVTLENIDQMMAKGEHFARHQFLSELPAVVGIRGVGERSDGKLVGFSGMKPPYGSMAEKAVVPKESTILIPDGVDAETAVALPSTALTSLFPLKWGVKIKPGETVLINGATGVAGKLAVQIAKLLGAGRVIGTGRNEESLKRIRELGADTIVNLKQSEEELFTSFKKEVNKGIDIILDFLWGYPTETLIKALVPQEISLNKHRIQLVQIGEKSGSKLTLPANALRTSGLEVSGGTKGITPALIQEGTDLIWEWFKQDKLHMDIEIVPLQDIESVWNCSDFQGKRIVVTP